jgi:hypothetical protein
MKNYHWFCFFLRSSIQICENIIKKYVKIYNRRLRHLFFNSVHFKNLTSLWLTSGKAMADFWIQKPSHSLKFSEDQRCVIGINNW